MTQVTKRALEASLKHLLIEKPFNKITVNDIAEDCGISRVTFYYHFKDIYDLVEWSCEEDAAKALAGKKTYDTWQEGLLNILHAVEANKPFIVNVYHSVSREHVERYLHTVVAQLIMEVVDEQYQLRQQRSKSHQPHTHAVPQEIRQTIAQFYTYAFVGVVLDWIRTDMHTPANQVVYNISNIMQGTIAGALDRFSADHL